MGRTLTPEQEIQQLKDTIREAHEILGDLQRTVKQAKLLVAGLLEHIKATVDKEMAQLSNHVQVANNDAAARLNQEVHEARREIMRQLSLTEMVLDPDTSSVHFKWPEWHFDDQIPLPYPNLPAKDHTQ